MRVGAGLRDTGLGFIRGFWNACFTVDEINLQWELWYTLNPKPYKPYTINRINPKPYTVGL